MNALLVVIVADHFQLSREIERVPEKHLIEDLAPDGADQPFDERMRHRSVGNRFYLPDFEYAQVGKPAVKAKQRVVVSAQMFWSRLARHSVIEHPAHTQAINRCGSHPKADQATSENIHHDHYPVAFQ